MRGFGHVVCTARCVCCTRTALISERLYGKGTTVSLESTLCTGSTLGLTWHITELLPQLFHHFVVVDSVACVASLSKSGPVDQFKRPVRIAEYSDTIDSGWRRMTANGYSPRALVINFYAVGESFSLCSAVPSTHWAPRQGGRR